MRPPNPFATCFTRPGALRYRAPASCSRPDDDLLRSLVDAVLHRGAAAICGPHGSGKSTLLTALVPLLQQHVAGVAHYRLSSDASNCLSFRRLIATPGRWLLVIDGWEQTPTALAAAVVAICRLRRVRLLVTCHRRCRWLPVVWQTSTDRSTARGLAESLLAPWPEYHGPLMDRFEHRWQRSGGNVRDLWFGLYDDFEALLAAAPARCR